MSRDAEFDRIIDNLTKQNGEIAGLRRSIRGLVVLSSALLVTVLALFVLVLVYYSNGGKSWL